MPWPRALLPLMVDAFHLVPRGAAMRSALSSAAMARGVTPATKRAKIRCTIPACASSMTSSPDEAGTILCRRCGHSAVLEGQHHRHAIASADLAAERDLVVDRFIVLQVARKTSVDGDADHALRSVARA